MSKLTPLERYQHDLDRSEIMDDPNQYQAVMLTQSLYEQLLKSASQRQG